MFDSNNLEIIKETVEDFFKKSTFEAEIEISLDQEGTVLVDLKTEDPQILIGEGGQTLSEIQHLLKAILKKKLFLAGNFEFFHLNLDINQYKEKKGEYLKELANSVADEVSLNKREKILPPLSAYERRIIHLELAKRSDVTSESIGQEPERRLIVKPC